MIEPHREKELLRTFAFAPKRNGHLELLATRKGREKVRLGLDHLGDLDPKRCVRIASRDQTPGWIGALLRALIAPKACYVLSSISSLEGCEVELGDALEAIAGQGSGAFVCCIPGRLAYFEGSSRGKRYLCRA